MIKVKQAECHDTCLDVTKEEHTANVNPIGMTNPVQWRVDCDSCRTCIRAGLATKVEALRAAIDHVQMTPEDYWKFRAMEARAS